MMPKNTYKPSAGSSLFSYIERFLQLRGVFLNGLPTRYIPPLLYIFSLGILYVGNIHYHEKTLRKIAQLQPKVDNLRLKFTILNSQYMLSCTQSEVARRVAVFGIYESKRPPLKIRVEEVWK